MKIQVTLLAVTFLFLGDPCSTRAQDAPTYSKDIVPFLKKYCIECHRTGKIKGGLKLETYEEVMKGLPRGRSLVIPGYPDKTKLVTTTEWKAKPFMPPKKEKKQPTDKERELLRAWVKAGAKNDTVAEPRTSQTQLRLDFPLRNLDWLAPPENRMDIAWRAEGRKPPGE